MSIKSTMTELADAVRESYELTSPMNVSTMANVITAYDRNSYYGKLIKRTVSVYKIPQGVTKIGQYAFRCCSELTSVSIPASVESIGEYAFFDCPRLTTVTIPARLTKYFEDAFAQQSNVHNVNIFGPGDICPFAFRYRTSIATVSITGNIGSVGECSFLGCTGLASITLPDSLSVISYSAFKGCTGLQSITLPSMLSTLGDMAFSSCTGLTYVYIPYNVQFIHSSTFAGCNNLRKLRVPCTLAIKELLQNQRTFVKELEIYPTSSKNYIDTSQYEGSTKLEKVDIEYGISRLYASSFAGCTNLQEVSIANNDVFISSYCFYNCSDLTTFPIGKAIYIGASSFYNCASLEAVTISSNCIINVSAFMNCTNLESVELDRRGSYSYKDIPEALFSGCTSLGNVSYTGISGRDVNVGKNAFESTKISSFVPSGNGVQLSIEVEERAFYNCENLSTVSKCIKVGSRAFFKCYRLHSIILVGLPPRVASDAFYKSGLQHIYCVFSKAEGEAAGAPWGAPDGCIIEYNYTE